MTVIDTFTIDPRFNGAAESANGGYACGMAVAHAGELGTGPLAVTLHAPVPLDTELRARRAGARTHIWSDEALIASVTVAAGRPALIDAVDFALAVAGQDHFGGHIRHPFPTCFVCGTERAEGDGLLLRPAPVPGRERTVACAWRPEATVADRSGVVFSEIVWSVLDCPGGWTGNPGAEPMVLGRMFAEIEQLPVLGGNYVVVARQDGRNGRTAINTSTLYDERGRAIARACAIWIAK